MMEVYFDDLASMELKDPPYELLEDYMTPLPDYDLDSSVTDITMATREPGSGENLPCKQLLRFILNSIIVGLLCLFGFVGNSVSYVVIGREKDIFPVARLLLRALALADNAFLILWFIQFSLKDLFVYTGSKAPRHSDTIDGNPVWLGIRVATYPLIFAIQGITIWLTLLLAATRWAVVCYPSSAAKYCTLNKVRWYVAVLTIVLVIYNIPHYFEVCIKSVQQRAPIRNTTTGPGFEPRTIYYLDATEFGNTIFYKIMYQQILYYIFSFFLPFFLLLGFNTRLIIAYREFRRKREAMLGRYKSPGVTATCSEPPERKSFAQRPSEVPSPRHVEGNGAGSASENNVTLIMIIIILVFIVCNAPGKLVQMATAYREPRCLSATFFARELSIILEVLSSCVNFLVYYAFLKRFCHHLGQQPCAALRGRGMPVGATDTTLVPQQRNGDTCPLVEGRTGDIRMKEAAKRVSEVALANCKYAGQKNGKLEHV